MNAKFVIKGTLTDGTIVIDNLETQNTVCHCYGDEADVYAKLIVAAPDMLSWLIEQEKVYRSKQGILNAEGHKKWESLKDLIATATNG